MSDDPAVRGWKPYRAGWLPADPLQEGQREVKYAPRASDRGHGQMSEQPRRLNSSPPRIVRVFEPRRGWIPLNWSELWAGRALLVFLVWRDIKVRYKQTALGAS